MFWREGNAFTSFLLQNMNGLAILHRLLRNSNEKCQDYTSYTNWIYAGVFYDIEYGLRQSGRTGMDEMLTKAVKDKIDYIITKSIGKVLIDIPS